jgi:hypothetical protein
MPPSVIRHLLHESALLEGQNDFSGRLLLSPVNDTGQEGVCGGDAGAAGRVCGATRGGREGWCRSADVAEEKLQGEKDAEALACIYRLKCSRT